RRPGKHLRLHLAHERHFPHVRYDRDSDLSMLPVASPLRHPEHRHLSRGSRLRATCPHLRVLVLPLSTSADVTLACLDGPRQSLAGEAPGRVQRVQNVVKAGRVVGELPLELEDGEAGFGSLRPHRLIAIYLGHSSYSSTDGYRRQGDNSHSYYIEQVFESST